MMRIAPSTFSADFARLGEDARNVIAAACVRTGRDLRLDGRGVFDAMHTGLSASRRQAA